MYALAQDLRFAYRQLRKAPGFTITIVVTLALGIGATTAIFSVCDAMLWKPVPLPDLPSAIMVLDRDPNNPDDFNLSAPADIDDVRATSSTIASLASFQQGLANIVATAGEPERVDQALVTANFFDVIGVQPAVGRGFQTGEDEPGRELEVIFSDAYWKRILRPPGTRKR